MLDLWAVWCQENGVSFDVFSKGADILVDQEEAERYASLGWTALFRVVKSTPVVRAEDLEWNPEKREMELRRRF